jgi:hypothetical protein
MAHSGSHASQELEWAEWLRHVAVSPKFQESNHICHISESVQHKKWNIVAFTPNLTTKILTRPPAYKH